MRAVCVSICLAWLASATPLRAQLPDGWPADVERDVREQLATAWKLEADAVRLEWGAYAGVAPMPSSRVELVGSGRGGHRIVRVTDSTGAVSTVRVRAGHSVTLPTAARRIERGEVLSGDAITTRDTIAWGEPRGDQENPTEGWVAYRALAEGEVLSRPAVRPPLTVEASGRVEVLMEQGAVRVRIPGTAIQSGRIGDEINVRTDSGQRLRGVVVGPGAVRLTHAGSRASTGELR
jgi:flagella basal body P-ring formation protein FlgA